MAFQISHFTSNGSIFYDLHSITHIFYIFFFAKHQQAVMKL